jgi:hypothetical protein
VRGTRHAHLAPEAGHGVGDASVIGRDKNVIDVPGRGSAAVHVFDHRPPGDVLEGLPGKAGRREAGGDDNDSMFMIFGTIADAFGATCGTHDE